MATYLVTNDDPLEIYPTFGSFFCASELEGLVDGRFHIIGLEDKGRACFQRRLLRDWLHQEMRKPQSLREVLSPMICGLLVLPCIFRMTTSSQLLT